MYKRDRTTRKYFATGVQTEVGDNSGRHSKKYNPAFFCSICIEYNFNGQRKKSKIGWTCGLGVQLST